MHKIGSKFFQKIINVYRFLFNLGKLDQPTCHSKHLNKFSYLTKLCRQIL